MPAPSIHAFAEKVAVINGAETPVGRAVALQLALQGSYVIAGRSESNEETARALAELQSLGTLASVVAADPATPDGARRLVAAAESTFGRIDLLVNCAGEARAVAEFELTGAAGFEAGFAGARAAFFVTQAALALMTPRPKPKIVNVAAALDTAAAAADPLRAAAHGALVALTSALARRLPPKFRVNAVAVSAREPAAANLDAELFRPPSGVAADDVARTVIFLLSAEAIGLNGQVLTVE